MINNSNSGQFISPSHNQGNQGSNWSVRGVVPPQYMNNNNFVNPLSGQRGNGVGGSAYSGYFPNANYPNKILNNNSMTSNGLPSNPQMITSTNSVL